MGQPGNPLRRGGLWAQMSTNEETGGAKTMWEFLEFGNCAKYARIESGEQALKWTIAPSILK